MLPQPAIYGKGTAFVPDTVPDPSDSGLHLSDCGGLALHVIAGQQFIVWTSDATEPSVNGFSASVFAFGVVPGMYIVSIGADGLILIGTPATGPAVVAGKVFDYQNHCA